LARLDHEQVATELNLPLGTAKTRIVPATKSQQIESQLAAMASGLLIFFGLRYHAEQTASAMNAPGVSDRE
jgi:hypothetical protein